MADQEVQELRVRVLINETASKASKWAKRLNHIPMLGGPLVEKSCERIWDELAANIIKTMRERSVVWADDGRFRGRVMKCVRGQRWGLFVATLLPDVGLVTTSAVEELASRLTKVFGWTIFLIIRDNRFRTERRVLGKVEFEIVYPALRQKVLKEVVACAKNLS